MNYRKFNLTLDIGNDAMQTKHDIASALLRVAMSLERDGLFPNSAQWIRDANGNRVGTFKYEER